MFNELSDGFEIFKLENIENSIGPGETKYIIAHFRPLTNMTYKLNLILHYTDDINVGKEKITIIMSRKSCYIIHNFRQFFS